MEMGTQIFSQFPVVSNFFHSFLWSLVIQHLKDFKGSCPHHSTMFPAWRHNRMVTLVTTAEEVSPAHSRAKKHLGWHRREAGIQKGVLYFPFFPLLFRFIDKTKEHQKKKKGGIWFPHVPVTQLQTLQLGILLLSSIHHLLLPFLTTMGIFQGKYLLWCYFIHKYFSTYLKVIKTLFKT